MPSLTRGAIGRSRLARLAATCMLAAVLLTVGTPGAPSGAAAPGASPLEVIISSGLSHPGAMALDPAGNLFIIDGGNDRVVEWSQGSLTTLGFTGLTSPGGLAVDAADDVFVTDGKRVVELPHGGTQVTLGFKGLQSPGGVAVDAAGDVFVTDEGQGRVLELPAGGGAQVTLGFTALFQPQGVVVDPAGDVFVANFGHNRITELPAAGGPQVTVGPTGVLLGPTAITLDAAGDLYLYASEASRLVELPAGGGAPVVLLTNWCCGGVAVNSGGDVFASDGYHNSVVEMAAGTGVAIPPVTGAVTAADGQATVSWSPPSDDRGSPVDLYIATLLSGFPASPGPAPRDTTVTHTTFGGLTNGVTYRFEVRAHNAFGSSPPSALSAVALPPFASTSAFAMRQYVDFVGRQPTGDESAAVLAALESGPAGDVIENLRSGDDAATNVDPVARLYFAYFSRQPDAGGLEYWVSRRRSGESLTAISDAFAASSEFTATYGSLSDRAFVTLLYEDVLGRAPDTAGLTYWVGQLDGGQQSRGQVMIGFAESNEYVRVEQPSVDVAVTWIDMLGVSPDQADFTTWVGELTSHAKTVSDLAEAIMAMPAYVSRAG